MASSPASMVEEILRSDLCAFIHRSFLELNPATPYFYNWHIGLLASKLEEVRQGKCRRLIVNIPPRHLKSHAVSIAFPAWLLGHQPSKKILTVSYAQELSNNLARHCRLLMQSPFYRSLFDTRLAPGHESVHDFGTIERGYRFSTSVEGVLTGRGGDIIILDDPQKADDTTSELRRQNLKTWYDNTLRSRLNNQETGTIIIVMQRLHADDLVAHVQEHEQWDVLSLPALAEHDEVYRFETPYGRRKVRRKAGKALHPDLISVETLASQKRGMTDYNFAAQYQQDPQPEKGNIVQREWLKFYTLAEKPESFGTILQSWDTAVKETEIANYSVCTTWGIKDRKAYLLDVFRRKLSFPDLKRAVASQADLHEATVVLIEDRSSGSSLIQQLKADGLSKVQAAPSLDGDKNMRLFGQTPMIEGEFVLFPKGADWLDTYLNELLSFPYTRHDDQVDSTVYALAWIGQNPIWSGNHIKKSWIRYYHPFSEDEKLRRVFMAWDTARKDGGQSDWTVCTIWVEINDVYYLLHMDRGIYTYSELRQVFERLVRQYKPFKILFEETAVGQALKESKDLYSHHLIKLKPVHPDPVGRFYTQQDKFSEGRVQFPEDATFMPEIERELLSYPHGTTTDIVDSIALALEHGDKGYDSTYSWVED